MTTAYQQATDYELNGDIEALEASERPRRPPLILVGAAVLSLFFVTQFLQLLPALGKLHTAKITVVAVVLLFALSRERIASRIRLREVPQLKLIIGILIFAAATAPLAVWPSESARFLADSYVKNVLFFYLLVQIVRTDRDSRVVAGAVIAGCATLVLAMLFGFGPLVTLTAENEVRVAIGDTYDPNDLALLFVVALPFAFFMIKGSGPLARLFLIGSMGLMLVGLAKGGSRGGFLGLLVVGGLIFMRGSRQVRKYTLMTVVIGALLFAFVAPPEYWSRIGTIYNYENDYNLRDRTGRIQVWTTGLKMWAAHPVAGVGINCFNIAHGKFSGSRYHVSPHNTLLQITSELGTVGLAFFLAIVAISFRAARRIRRVAAEEADKAELWWMASAVEVSLIGFLVSSFFLTHAYSTIFFFVTAMSTIVYTRYRAMTEGWVKQENQLELG